MLEQTKAECEKDKIITTDSQHREEKFVAYVLPTFCQRVRVPLLFEHMAYDSSYTVLIVPLQNSLFSLDALHCFLWLKRRRDMEREKDALLAGLQVLEKAQQWYQNRLQLNLQREVNSSTGDPEREDRFSCALRSCMQRVHGSLGTLMSDTCLWSNPAPGEEEGSDWDLRWTNATLVQELIQQNLQISMLELEKAQLQRLLSSSKAV